MSLFKRRKSAEADQSSSDTSEPIGDALVDLSEPPADEVSSAPSATAATDLPAGTDRAATFDRSSGPYDSSEVDGEQGRLDLGALFLPLVPGVELQLQMDEASQQVTGIFVILGESAVQLQAFAAPRSEGIWTDICDEIAAGITSQGGTADPGYGRFGRELLAQVPSQQPDGRMGFQPLRFAGIDGPRWLLRAVFHGRAAVESEAAQALEDLVEQSVVNRGVDPMGPRELLPLRLPVDAEVALEQSEAVVGESGLQPERISDNAPAETFDDLTPFERGPEITERR